MNIDEVTAGLSQLGFEDGWAYSDIGYPEGIILWDHTAPIPSTKEVEKASKLWADTLAKREIANTTKREALLKRLGLTQDEFQTLIDG